MRKVFLYLILFLPFWGLSQETGISPDGLTFLYDGPESYNAVRILQPAGDLTYKFKLIEDTPLRFKVKYYFGDERQSAFPDTVYYWVNKLNCVVYPLPSEKKKIKIFETPNEISKIEYYKYIPHEAVFVTGFSHEFLKVIFLRNNDVREGWINNYSIYRRKLK